MAIPGNPSFLFINQVITLGQVLPGIAKTLAFPSRFYGTKPVLLYGLPKPLGLPGIACLTH